MSTAGKVLVVLSMLMAMVWVLMTASVAQLHMNATAAVAKLQTEVAKLEIDAAAVAAKAIELRDAINFEQVKMDKDLAVIRARLADIETARSETLETSARVKIQLEDAQSTQKNSELARDTRLAEKNAEIAAKAAAEAEVEHLKQVNVTMMDELAKMREQYTSIVSQSKELSEKLSKDQPIRRVRRASLAR